MDLLEHLDKADIIVIDGISFRPKEFRVGDFKNGRGLPNVLKNREDIMFHAKNDQMESFLTLEGATNKAFYNEDNHFWETPCGTVSTYVATTRR